MYKSHTIYFIKLALILLSFIDYFCWLVNEILYRSHVVDAFIGRKYQRWPKSREAQPAQSALPAAA
jgi:hypothetical protein